MLSRLNFVTTSLLLTLAAATNSSADTNAVCSYLYAKYPAYFAWDPLGPNALETVANASVYTEINTVYWNIQNADYRAACAFFPESAAQVSDAVKQLNQYSSAPFALKSGGHNPAPGFASTDGGVIISFEPNLASTVRSADGKHFVVGAGSRWGDVYNVTTQTNQVVVGGRLAHIGVAGLTLGGGLSYYSAQYGLACDNVDNFEAVLANGTIVNANRTSNPDLWWALRGGGNQFAIVTKFTTQAHPAGIDGRIWGGIRAYTPESRLALFAAMQNFTENYPDAKAAVIPTFQFALPGNALNIVTGPIIFFFYDGPDPGTAFAMFDGIDALVDDTAEKSYPQMSQEGGGASMIGFRNSFHMHAYPNLPKAQMVDFYESMWNYTYAQAFNDSLTSLDVQILGMDPQPMSVRIAKASQAQGGNALGLDPNHGDRVWFENDFLWTSPLCDTKCPEISRELSDTLMANQKKVYGGIPPTNYKSGNISEVSYNPLFMNDAAPYQDVYSSYGSVNLARLQKIKAAYDPNGFLTTRQGGFKLPA